jgi:hypothetical protein
MPRGRGTRRGERQDLSWSDPDPEPLKPRRRKVVQAGLPALCRGLAEPTGKVEPFEARAERPVSEPPGEEAGPRDQHQPPTEPAPARAPGDERPISAWLFGAGTETALKRRASSFLLRQEPHAGESGVSRKAGPISLWALRACKPPESRRLGIIPRLTITRLALFLRFLASPGLTGRVEPSAG